MDELGEVYRVSSHLKSLVSLSVLSKPSKLDVSHSELVSIYCHTDLAKNVIILDANHCKVKDVDGLHLFVNLKELDLSYNNLKSFEFNYFPHTTLSTLILDGNLLGNTLDLSHFPNLKVLSLNKTGISSLKMATKFCSTITSLLLRDNSISDLCEVNNLRHLLFLEELDMTGNVCLEDLDEVLSRIALKALVYLNLTIINGVKLNADSLLRSESLQMWGIGKFKSGSNDHAKLLNFIKQKATAYQPPKTPIPGDKSIVHSAPQIRRPLCSFTNLTPSRPHPRAVRSKTPDIDSGRPGSIESSISKMSLHPQNVFDSIKTLVPKSSLNVTMEKEKDASIVDFPDILDDDGQLDESFSSSRTITISKTEEENPYYSPAATNLGTSHTFRNPETVGEMLKRCGTIKQRASRPHKQKVFLKRLISRCVHESTKKVMTEIGNVKASMGKRITDLEHENLKLREFIEEQLEVIPTNIKFKPYGEDNYIIEWKNMPKYMMNVERHELEVNNEVFSVRGSHERALIADPRNRETIRIRTVNKLTGKKSAATQITFSKSPNKENLV